MRFLRSLMVTSAILMAADADAQPAGPQALLTPSSPWQVDYADNECRLVREFGRDGQRIALRIARASSLEYFDVVVAGPGVPDLPLRRSTRIRLEPQAAEIESEGYSMRVPEQPFHFIRLFDIDSPFLRQFQPTQLMTITNGSFSATLRIDNAVQALAALQTCHDDLLVGWGFDIAMYRALTSPPLSRGGEALWVTTDDYPTEALRNNVQGVVTMMMNVGTDGRVKRCIVIVSSGTAALDTAACSALTRRARFNPAIGIDGQPTEAPFIKRVRWELPDI